MTGENQPRPMADRLRDYATAIEDPSRGIILIELDRAGELTPTQLAHRIGLAPNTVYHHISVLLEMGLLDPPRVVPGDTYVEKYYHIKPEIRAALRLDPTWYADLQESVTAVERQLHVVSTCLTMSHLLRKAARAYLAMDAETLDAAIQEQGPLSLLLDRVSRDELGRTMLALQIALTNSEARWAENTAPRTDLLLIACLPFLEDEGQDTSC